MAERSGIAERLEVFTDTFGEAGLLFLILIGVAGAMFILIRGPGFALFLLTVSYALSFVQEGGVLNAAFFIRVLTLLLLAVSVVRRFVRPRWPFWAILAYALLGLLFSAASPVPLWSLQKGLLLLATVFALGPGVSAYLSSFTKMRALLRMFVVAGALWALLGFIFSRDITGSEWSRFAGGGETRATNYAATGAIFFPFMLWAAIQRKGFFWRILGVFGVVLIPLLLFLSGTRTAMIFLILASIPLLLRGEARNTMRIWLLVGVASVGLFLASGIVLSQGKTGYMAERLITFSLSGREQLWAHGLNVCLASPIFGRGAGANDFLGEMGAGNFHNAYLSIWCNTGIVGVFLVLAVLVSQSVSGVLLLRRATDPIGQDALRLALGFIVALTAKGMVDNAFASPSNEVTAILLISLTIMARVRDLTEQAQPAQLLAEGPPASTLSTLRLTGG